jgi:very-short-patch-repair endonuclease
MNINEKLQAQRRVLLDLTYRNRLLSLPRRTSNRAIVLHDELSPEVLRLLLEKRELSFLPLPGIAPDSDELSPDEIDAGEDTPVLSQPDDDDVDERGIASRHRDLKLQTKLHSEHLQKRLLEIYYASQTLLEEQGVNLLFLALGQLQYVDQHSAVQEKGAPLILVPVKLERRTVRDRFVVKWTEEDPTENLSLVEKLRVDFNLEMPEFPVTDEFDVRGYFSAIEEAIANQKGWKVVENSMQLGFFSFAKLLMFRDLDPDNWPEESAIDENGVINGLLGNGFSEPDLGPCAEEKLDEILPVSQMKHIMDCDSSQAMAIEAVRRGQNVVIQGPPGTGKSQTIANLIATAVCDGKKVLFMAEKMAALEVVKRRLQSVGLGPICLELHSNKANKRAVLDELGNTLAVGRPTPVDVKDSIDRLTQLRDDVNRHATMMHSPIGAARVTPFAILGHLSKYLPRIGRPAFKLPGAEQWTSNEAKRRASILKELCDYLPQLASPQQNIWRGVDHPPLMRPVAEELLDRVRPASVAIRLAIVGSENLARSLNLPPPPNFAGMRQLCDIAACICDAPQFDRSTITAGVWSVGLTFLHDAVRSGRTFNEIIQRRGNSINELAWDRDWTSERSVVAANGRSLFRWLKAPYRQAIAQLRGVTRGDFPKAYALRLTLLDDIIAGRKATIILSKVAPSARSAFGGVWRDHQTDWDLAESILGWVEQQSKTPTGITVRKIAAGLSDRTKVLAALVEVKRALSDAEAAAAAVVSTLKLDLQAAFGSDALSTVDLHALSSRLDHWLSDLDGLMTWLTYKEILLRARVAPMGPAVDAIIDNPGIWGTAEDTFWVAYYLHLLTKAAETHPDLAKFEGRRHDDLIRQYRVWDRKRLEIAQFETAQIHFEKIPRAAGAVGSFGILRSEIARKRGHMALRKLLTVCGGPVQTIKPVFMMSPLSVAQFLAPGALNFDLLVVDEASQVEPVDALGAIARCKQIVVVGDDKQLPPTTFFSRMLDGDEPDDTEEGAQAKDLESILSLCSSKGIRQRMLQWHYRSRHESLIAVSNKEFYDSRLFIVPNPDSDRSKLGLSIRYLPEGRYDRGNTAKNHVEAVAIAKAVIEHARTRPHLTLGVGAMSVRQRQAITDEVELQRRQFPELEQFFVMHPNEPFFVKNLENIQGDERDVIFISIGYAKSTTDEKLYQNFGPLNSDGGHRRLNVLMTRARERCEVFTSILADDIRLDERSKLGIIALKTFLKYAETGDLGVPTWTGAGADSPFEEAVQEALAQRGFQVDNQVGVAGFFVDLAVVDPDVPGRYLLGVECDGATYHSAPCARDRDRLRQEILEAHGWTIHRIWSTDWFQKTKDEMERLLAAIGKAKASVRAAPLQHTEATLAPPALAVMREEPVVVDNGMAALSSPYTQAMFQPEFADRQPHEVPLTSMARTLLRVIEIEGPIHADEIVTRVRELWGLGRAGSRIRGVVEDSLKQLLRGGLTPGRSLMKDSDWYWLKGTEIRIRNRALAESRTLKKPELLPPQEIRESIVTIVREAHGASQSDIAVSVARMLGFQSTSQQLRDRINDQVDAMVNGKTLALEGDLYILSTV